MRKLCLILSVLCSSWGVPLAITVAAVSLNKIGYDASEVSVGWCWVRIHAPDRVLWMLLTGKIWEFLAYLTLPVLYILIKRHIYVAVRNQTRLLPAAVHVTPPTLIAKAETVVLMIPLQNNLTTFLIHKYIKHNSGKH